MAKKFYGVRKGLVPGIYTEWNEVQNQIKGYSGAIYKGFSTEDDAKNFVYGNDEKSFDTQAMSPAHTKDFTEDISIYVDGSYKDEKVGFGIVILKDDKVIMKDCGRFTGKDEFTSQRNAAGEIYAMIRSIQLIKANGFNNIRFYHDYLGVAYFINGAWRPKNDLTRRYLEYFTKHMNGINCAFEYVPAHTGNMYNEMADKLAKLGTTL